MIDITRNPKILQIIKASIVHHFFLLNIGSQPLKQVIKQKHYM